MELLKEFSEKILNENNSFSICILKERRTCSYHFVQSKIGTAWYIYGISGHEDVREFAKLDLNPKLVAIIANNIIYIIDEFFFDLWRPYEEKTELPKNVKIFSKFVNEKNYYVKEFLFPEFYNNLKTDPEIAAKAIKTCKEEARKALFSKNNVLEKPTIHKCFNEQDIANMLCGFINFEKETQRRFEIERNDWIAKKTIYEKTLELMKTSEIAYSWELAIAEGLRSVDAEYVTVEFEMNDKTASSKIHSEVIFYVLRENDNFESYNFKVAKHGEKLLKDLGAGNYWSNNALKCEHITRITYGKKVLYARKENIKNE